MHEFISSYLSFRLQMIEDRRFRVLGLKFVSKLPQEHTQPPTNEIQHKKLAENQTYILAGDAHSI